MNTETDNKGVSDTNDDNTLAAPQPPTSTPSPSMVLDMSPRSATASQAAPYQYDDNTPVAPSAEHPCADFDVLAAVNAQPQGVVVMPDGRVLTDAEADAEADAEIVRAMSARHNTVAHAGEVPPMPQSSRRESSQRAAPPMPDRGVEAPRLVTAPPLTRQAPPQPTLPPVASKPRRSPFRFHENFCAGAMVIDETTYWYREMLDKEKDWLKQRFEWLAERLGISLDQFLSDDFDGAILAELAKLPEYIEETFDILLGDCGCIRAWDWDDVPVTPENVRAVSFEAKAALFEQVTRSTTVGVSQAAFSTRPSK